MRLLGWECGFFQWDYFVLESPSDHKCSYVNCRCGTLPRVGILHMDTAHMQTLYELCVVMMYGCVLKVKHARCSVVC